MIYCTFAVGNFWNTTLRQSGLTPFSKENEVHILTDRPELYPYAKATKYDRDVFSYYDKLPFMFDIIKDRKERVMFFDADNLGYIKAINVDEFDDESIYSDTLYNYSEKTQRYFEDKRHTALLSLWPIFKEEVGVSYIDYPNERNLSFPYLENIDEITEDIKRLQSKFESVFAKGIDWKKSCGLDKYSEVGCGYSEGGAVAIQAHKHNIPMKRIWHKEIYSKPNFDELL